MCLLFDRVARRYCARPSDLLPGFSPVQAVYFDLLCAGAGSTQDNKDAAADKRAHERMLAGARSRMR
jgi:hypothetical protein